MICAVRKCEQAPHRKATEDVCGAEGRKCTVWMDCGGVVRCGRCKIDRMDGLRK